MRALRRSRTTAFVAAALCCGPAALAAQMTIEGRVTTEAGAPVEAASVSIAALDLSTRTSAEGRYNFIVRSAVVRGQTVQIVARHARFGTATAQIAIVGGSVTQNLVLVSGRVARAPRTESPDRQRDSVRAASESFHLWTDVDQSSAPSLGHALAGRFAPLHVSSAAALSGSVSLTHRATRTFMANPQALVVVDGVPIESQGFSAAAQRFGLGGFDYGTPLNDISIEDVESVRLIDGASAALLYGSRAANGVLLVATKSGREITGFRVALRQRLSAERVSGLPEYQNVFGQGLGGAYEFFDGQGGGVNDDVAQSWGPRLDGQPIAQHSQTEPMRPEVRHWLPRPDNVREYFEAGRTLDGSLTALGSRDRMHGRAAFNWRDANGVTPGSNARRLGLTLSAGAQPFEALRAAVNFQVVGADAKHRPGTGFDGVNPVAGFTTLGRQVDMDALRATVITEDGEQINWIYTERNNPFFATAQNSNGDERRTILGGGSLGYAFNSHFAATVRAGTNDVVETRKVTVANGWRGGFPSSLGRGDFSGGGTDESTLEYAERFAALSLDASRFSGAGLTWSAAAGGEVRSNTFNRVAVVTDQPSSGAASVTNENFESTHGVTSAFASATASRGTYFHLVAGARLDQSSSLPKSYSIAYPSLSASFDVANAMSARDALRMSSLKLLGRWWRAGNELGARTLYSTYFARGTPIAPDLDLEGPEITTGIELGAEIASLGRRVELSVVGYRERSKDVLVATPTIDGAAFVSQTGEIFNGGVETSIRVGVLEGEDLNWTLAGGIARNVSTVDELQLDVAQTALSPTLFGVGLAARVGQSAGVILGTRFLRDAPTGSLILRNGLPIADASEPMALLGTVQPDWSANVRSRLRWRGAELFLLVDARLGGQVFSATNQWGSFAGSLESTLIGDRAQPGTEQTLADSLTIAGIDSVTGTANTTKVSAEQYFHALGGIAEPWVHDASFAKLREARLTWELPTRFLAGFREHRLTVSIVARNLLAWSEAPNIDPETVFSTSVFRGFEMGQLPSARSFGIQLAIAP